MKYKKKKKKGPLMGNIMLSTKSIPLGIRFQILRVPPFLLVFGLPQL